MPRSGKGEEGRLSVPKNKGRRILYGKRARVGKKKKVVPDIGESGADGRLLHPGTRDNSNHGKQKGAIV